MCYECCLSASQSSTLPALFSHLIDFSLQGDLDERMGDLLRSLLSVFSLYSEGKRMDDKVVKNSQKSLLHILTNHPSSRLSNPRFALIQRLIINSPDRTDSRSNTVDCLLTLLLSLSEKEKQRTNEWIALCSRCGVANIRMCVVCLARALLMSRYVSDSVVNQQEEVSSEKEESSMDIECSIVQRELFFDEKPLYFVFFDLILNRCNDIVISIRAEATHVRSKRSHHM